MRYQCSKFEIFEKCLICTIVENQEISLKWKKLMLEY